MRPDKIMGNDPPNIFPKLIWPFNQQAFNIYIRRGHSLFIESPSKDSYSNLNLFFPDSKLLLTLAGSGSKASLPFLSLLFYLL